jgi:hypothetical protein
VLSYPSSGIRSDLVASFRNSVKRVVEHYSFEAPQEVLSGDAPKRVPQNDAPHDDAASDTPDAVSSSAD